MQKARVPLLAVIAVALMAGCKKDNPVGLGGNQEGSSKPSTAVPTDAVGLHSMNPTLSDPVNAAGDSILTFSPEEASDLMATARIPAEARLKTGGGQGDRIASWSLTNQRILDRSYRDNNRYVGVQCKPWVSRVALDATGVSLPSTVDGGYGWYWNYSPDVVSWCGRAEYASPGQILQMWLGYRRPHTVIIVGTSPSGMYWIDSNWNWDLTVRLHWVSYSSFYSMTSGYFTINQVNR